ncbi:MAG: SRPBCC domain-containing protein [bacterium]
MRYEGGFEIEAPPEKVWESFWDEAMMTAWLPGCQEAHWEGRKRVVGEVEQSVAQLKARFAFEMEVVENEPPRHIRLRGEGRGISLGSSVSLEMSIRLEPAEGNRTRVAYEMEARITGKLALVGNFVLKIKTRELERLMAAQVKERLE